MDVQRSEIGNNTEMSDMMEHNPEQIHKRESEPFTKSGSDGEDLIGLGTAGIATHAESLIQIHTEHGVGNFQLMDAAKICLGLAALEGNTPILRHRSM